MSSIRTKRKHVLDSDSEEDASPPPVVAEAVVAPVAPAKAVVDLTEEDDARSSPIAVARAGAQTPRVRGGGGGSRGGSRGSGRRRRSRG